MRVHTLGVQVALVMGILLVGVNAIAGLAEGLAAIKKADYDTALKELIPEAENGDAEAQFQLGALYGQGLGVKQDPAAAFKWNQMAANGGHAAAQYQLSTLYSKGEGVAQNSALAMQWLRTSADARNPLAMEDLGSAYQKGSGVNADKLLALALYNLSIFSIDLPSNKRTFSSISLMKGLSETEVKSGWNIFCVLRDSKSLIGALDAYVADPKRIPANACAASAAK